MAISVQLISRAASEQLSMKYCDLPTAAAAAPGPSSSSSSLSCEEDLDTAMQKRLTLPTFLLSNYANSPRRRLSVDDGGLGLRSPGRRVFEAAARGSFYAPPAAAGEDARTFIISVTDERPVLQLRNCVSTPRHFIKKTCAGSLSRASDKAGQTVSWKYKLLYLCGVSNVDMVDNYVTLPRCTSRRCA